MNCQKTIMIKILFGVLFAVILGLGIFLFQHNAKAITLWITTLGWGAGICFIMIYTAATLLMLPTMVLTLAGGAIFGPVYGTIINLAGATLGAACAFACSRFFFQKKFRAEKHPSIEKIFIGIEQNGWKFLALVRLIPIMPFNMVNYGLGLTNVKFRLYLVTTALFLLPLEILSTYCGHMGSRALSLFKLDIGLYGIMISLLLLVFIYFFSKKRFNLF